MGNCHKEREALDDPNCATKTLAKEPSRISALMKIDGLRLLRTETSGELIYMMVQRPMKRPELKMRRRQDKDEKTQQLESKNCSTASSARDYAAQRQDFQTTKDTAQGRDKNTIARTSLLTVGLTRTGNYSQL